MPIAPPHLVEDALTAYLAPRVRDSGDLYKVVTPVFDHWDRFGALKQEASVLLEQIAKTAQQCAVAKKENKKMCPALELERPLHYFDLKKAELDETFVRFKGLTANMLDKLGASKWKR